MIAAAILEWIKKHTVEIIAGSAVVGGGVATIGVVNAHKAKKINKEASEIQKAAIEKHDLANQKTSEVLEKLGETKKMVIDSFVYFADVMEQIQARPKIKNNFFSTVKLPSYEPTEIKAFSGDLQTALATIGGGAGGAMVGLAAFGATAVITAPALISAGVILCVKGISLKKKAIENKKEALKLEKTVEEIIRYYEKLQDTAVSFEGSIKMIYEKYLFGLGRIEETLATKKAWKEFSSREKKVVENTVLLARMLYEMARTSLIVQDYKEDQIETINTLELEKLQKQAAKLAMA